MSPDTERVPPHDDTLRDLTEVIGKALYGWGDDEPNGATGATAMIEVAQIAAAVYEAGFRGAQAGPPPLSDLIHDVLEVQRTGCNHEGIGKPGCRTCDPRVYEYVRLGAEGEVGER